METRIREKTLKLLEKALDMFSGASLKPSDTPHLNVLFKYGLLPHVQIQSDVISSDFESIKKDLDRVLKERCPQKKAKNSKSKDLDGELKKGLPSENAEKSRSNKFKSLFKNKGKS